MVQNVTAGIIAAVQLQNTSPTHESMRELMIEDRYSFTDFEPEAFKRLRNLHNVTEEHYIAQIKLSTKVPITSSSSSKILVVVYVLLYCSTPDCMY
jgi:hypothetical protein